MKVKERDDLLIRIDEKVKQVIDTQAVHSKHLAMINGSIQKHNENLTALNTTVYGKKSDKGLCGDMSNLKKFLLALLLVVFAGGTIGGLELSDVINLFGG